MKQLIVFLSIVLSTTTNHYYSQYDFDGNFNFDIGFNYGGTGYLGDIGGTEEIGKRLSDHKAIIVTLCKPSERRGSGYWKLNIKYLYEGMYFILYIYF